MALTYILLLLISAVFHIMYQGDLSFVLLVFMLVFPLILLILLIISASLLKVTAYCEHPFTDRGKAAAVKITLNNRSPFPISHFVIRVQYKSLIPFEDVAIKKYELSAALGAGMCETVSLNLTPEHCGVLEVALKSIKIYDLLGILHISRKIRVEQKITVQPQIMPVTASTCNNLILCDESNVFSHTKAGDDPSEIFSLREYREGDRPNCIHWKLSSRNDSMIVKELSQPVGSHILIITDFAGCTSASEIDCVLDMTASLSDFLAENGVVHTIASASTDFDIHSAEITEEEMLYAEMNRFAENIKQIELNNRFAYIASVADNTFFAGNSFSRIIAVCANASKAYADELARICGEITPTIICTRSAPEANDGEEITSAEIIYACSENPSADIKDFEV